MYLALKVDSDPTSQASSYNTPTSDFSEHYAPFRDPRDPRDLRDPFRDPKSDSSFCSEVHPFSEYTESVESTITGVNTSTEVTLRCFKCAVITQWDNIVGPRLWKAWKGEEVTEKLVSYVNMHVLTGDLEEGNYGAGDRDRERKLLFLPEQDVILFALIFNVSSLPGSSKTHCVSLVFPYGDRAHCDRVTNLYSFLYKSCGNIKDAMKENTLGAAIQMSQIGTLVAHLDRAVHNLLKYSVAQIKRPIFYFGDGVEHASERIEFLKRVYQGVLECAGFSLLIGRRCDLLMMEQLSLLISYIMPPQQLTIFPTPEGHTTYTPYVNHQSLVYYDSEAEVLNPTNTKLMDTERFPLAVINVTTRTVKVTTTLKAWAHRDKDRGGYLIGPTGPFVDKIVARMIPFRSKPEFLSRFGALAVAELNCKVDVFIKMFHEKKNLRVFKNFLKWDDRDLEIFKAFACRRDASLARQIFVTQQRLTPSDEVNNEFRGFMSTGIGSYLQGLQLNINNSLSGR